MILTKIPTFIFLSAILIASNSVQATKITNFSTLTQKQIEQSYYFDWNRNAMFRASMNKQFKSSKISMPDWLHQGRGGSAPAKIITKDTTQFVLLDTCKPRECHDNIAYILFDPATKNTSIVGKFNKKTVWVGNIGKTERQILSNVSGLK